MQPYFFPYIGYFQLIRAVNKFVFYDDVNFIKSGWVNRNRLLIAGSVRYITVPLVGASSFKKINEIHVKSIGEWSKIMLTSVAQNYAGAPFYKPVRELLETVVISDNDNLASLATHSVTVVADYLGLSTEFIRSSTIYGNHNIKSVDRVLDICRLEKAKEYWNLPGGRTLYDAEVFLDNGIDLKFVDGCIMPYQQRTAEFHPSLSILDVLMYNEPAKVLAMLGDYACS